MSTDEGPRTITAAAELIRRGELTPSDLLEQCLARIDRYEGRVRAWAYLDRERARADAARLTEELKSGQDRGPLHGIPVGIKDIIDVFDMPTGCGSRAWADSYARRDAACVGRLRQAGAVILGKTVTTPFAFLDPPPTRNPWNLYRTPGGSSSGSAAAVACGMCLAALGTQTGGSVTRPASYCGVYSLKPTHGLVSVDGVLPLAPSLDHVGVMANCVRDLAVVLQVVAEPYHHAVDNYLEGVDHPPASVNLGRFRGPFDDLTTEPVRRVTDDVGTHFRAVELPLPAGFPEAFPRYRTVAAAQAAAYHGDRLRRRPDDYPPAITRLVREGNRYTASELFECLEHKGQLAIAMRHALEPASVTLTPATTTPAPPPDTTGNPACNIPWSYIGFPTVSVPVDWTADGLPLAIQLVARAFEERDLLGSAVVVEQRAGFKPRPLPL